MARFEVGESGEQDVNGSKDVDRSPVNLEKDRTDIKPLKRCLRRFRCKEGLLYRDLLLSNTYYPWTTNIRDIHPNRQTHFFRSHDAHSSHFICPAHIQDVSEKLPMYKKHLFGRSFPQDDQRRKGRPFLQRGSQCIEFE